MQQDDASATRVAPSEGGEELAALLGALPRALHADGSASTLAAWWVASRRQAVAAGEPPFARHALTPGFQSALFEARRARRLARGLEGAEKLLSAEGAGLERTPAGEAVRISRLLVVSADGAPRFYRQVERLRSRFENRLEVLLCDCDEHALGAAGFGPGRRARALLIHHKDAVVRLLSSLDTQSQGTGPD